MTSNIITTVFAVLFGALVLATLGSFLLFVPALSIISTVAILLALMFMFALGLYAGGRRIRVHRLLQPGPGGLRDRFRRLAHIGH
jgi:hypothetical protein